METHFPNMDDAKTKLACERVMADLQALAHDTETLIRATAENAGDKAREARTRVLGALERAKTTCAELQAQSVQSARAAAKQADETIRAHPYESLAIALGIGILVGAVLRRK